MASMLLRLASCLAVVSLGLPTHREGAPGDAIKMLKGLRGRLSNDPAKFHKRGDGKYPDVKDQTYATTVKCTKERDEMAALLNKLLAEKAAGENSCKTAITEQQTAVKLSAKNTQALKQVLHDHLAADAKMPAEYKAYYKHLMCSKIYNAYHLKNDYARIDLLEVCAGKKKMVASFLQMDELALAAATEAPKERGCFQSRALRDQVMKTKTDIKKTQHACAAVKLQLKTDLAKYEKEETDLWTRYHAHKSKGPEIKAHQEKAVQGRFCTVVLQNHLKTEVNIKAFFDTACVHPPPTTI